MAVKRPVDVIDWRGKRAEEIVKAVNKLDYALAIFDGRPYGLGPYEIIRIVNIFYTSNNIKRSLDGFLKMIKRREKYYVKLAREDSEKEISPAKKFNRKLQTLDQ